MFCRKQDYLEVEKVHYKVLKIVYNSNECYEELLGHNNEVSIHQKTITHVGYCDLQKLNKCKSRFHEKLFFS